MIQSRRMRCAGHVARMRDKKNVCRMLIGEPKGKRSLGRPRCRWVDNIKVDLRGIRWDGISWIDLSQYRNKSRAFVNTVKNFKVA
jgi:hypothetical protein